MPVPMVRLKAALMNIQNVHRWAPRGKRVWLFSALALCVASAVRLALHPFLGPVMPGAAFCIAAAMVEYFFGLIPALTVMLLGLGIADFLFVPPYGQIDVINRADVMLAISYPLVTLFTITLIERLRRAQFSAELIAAVAMSRYEMLLRADNERALSRRAVDETHRLIRHLPHYHDAIILLQAVDRNAAQGAKEMAPGRLFADAHPDDIERLQRGLQSGRHRVRIGAGDGVHKLVDCICERFTTHAGEFLILRTVE
jgi:K+-sensing histidine kinase KdpD